MLLAEVAEVYLCQGFLKGLLKFAAPHVMVRGISSKTLDVPDVMVLVRPIGDNGERIHKVIQNKEKHDDKRESYTEILGLAHMVGWDMLYILAYEGSAPRRMA